MSSFKEYKITFGGKEYALESDDGGKSGSVYEIGADRWDISYAYLYEDTGVQRFRAVLAAPGEFEVSGEGIDAADEKSLPSIDQIMTMFADLADGGARARAEAAMAEADASDFDRLLNRLSGTEFTADDEPYYCGTCPECDAAAKESN
jgi:hypothetical protein